MNFKIKKPVLLIVIIGALTCLTSCNEEYESRLAELKRQRDMEHGKQQLLMDSLDHVMTTTLRDINNDITKVLQDEGIFSLQIQLELRDMCVLGMSRTRTARYDRSFEISIQRV